MDFNNPSVLTAESFESAFKEVFKFRPFTIEPIIMSEFMYKRISRMAAIIGGDKMVKNLGFSDQTASEALKWVLKRNKRKFKAKCKRKRGWF